MSDDEFWSHVVENRIPVDRYTVLYSFRHDRRLIVDAARDGSTHRLELFEPWSQMILKPGDVINIIEAKDGVFATERSHPKTAGMTENLVVVGPDFLVSGSLASTLHECMRKSVYSLQIRRGELSASAVLGNCTHELCQDIMQDGSMEIEDVIAQNAVNLSATNTSYDDARAFLLTMRKNFELFKKQHNFKTLAVEENLWSPIFGLKGKTDATVSMDGNIIPVEIKTGKKWLLTHGAQTLMYSLLIADTYSTRRNKGILYYAAENQSHEIFQRHAEMRDLILLRNKFYFESRNKFKLPEKTKDLKMCKKCFYQDICNIQIQPKHQEFFAKWSRLLTLEDFDTPAIWTQKPLLSNVVLQTTDGNYCTFLLNQISTITSNDSIVISHDDPHGPFGLAYGKVLVSSNLLKVFCDRPLRPKTGANFRIDLMPSTSTVIGIMRQALFQMFLTNSKLCDLIVDNVPPMFEEKDIKMDFRNLNESQIRAVKHCFSMHDYCLLEGFPGTGKSTLLSFLLEQFSNVGKTVLFTSHTHSAVDTVLCKLKQSCNVDFVRLGPMERIHELIKPHALDLKTPEQVNLRFLSAKIVAVTCLSSQHPLLLNRKFDICIVDEASQVMFPAVLGPMLLANQFILVGDRMQLTPVVRNETASREGLRVSLFEMLLERHPHASCALDIQYRMNKEIMDFSNSVTYNGRLKCGIQNQTLRIKNVNLPLWAKDVVYGPGVCFLNTESPESKTLHAETSEKVMLATGIVNIGQIDLIRTLCTAYYEEDVAVITPYRAQLSMLHELKVECCTIDQFQGRDKNCIIISLVRCNPKSKVGDLLRDWRRFNVAVTRARCKLILVGSLKTMKETPLWNIYFEYLKNIVNQ